MFYVHNINRPTAADVRLRQRDHWSRPFGALGTRKCATNIRDGQLFRNGEKQEGGPTQICECQNGIEMISTPKRGGRSSLHTGSGSESVTCSRDAGDFQVLMRPKLEN